MSIDKVTREKWKAEFALHAKSEGYDVTPWVTNFGVGFIRNETQALWEMYRLGRWHEQAVHGEPRITLTVVEAVNWVESYRGVLSDSEIEDYTKGGA